MKHKINTKIKIVSIVGVLLAGVFVAGIAINSQFFVGNSDIAKAESNSGEQSDNHLVNHAEHLMMQNMNMETDHDSETAPIELWSDPNTWTGVDNLGGDGLPNENTHVLIENTRRVVIDFEGAKAKNIISQGTLEFQENSSGDNVSLDTGWLLVDGGALKAGSETNEFTDNLTITLNDNDPSATTQSLTRTRNNSGELEQDGRIICYGLMAAIDYGNHFIGVYSGKSMPQGNLTNEEYAELIDTPESPYDPNYDFDALIEASSSVFNARPTRNPDPAVDTCQADTLPGSVGKISFHGDTSKTEWSYLDETAQIGDDVITVTDATGWQVGDAVAITSTDYDHRQAEDFFITGVNGNEITLDGKLNFMHFGEFTEGGVDQRAEVANLTRNITIQTDEAIKNREVRGIYNEFFNRKFNDLKVSRGHVLFSAMSRVNIDGVEFKDLGQEGMLGKYPVHFHHGMNMDGSYVKNSVVHKSLNKCYTLHVTNNLLVENNIGYDVVGHCVYLETDEEWPNRSEAQKALRSTGNVFDGNLVFDITKPEASQRSKSYDIIVSGFWITDSRNSFRNNVAGGAGDADGSHFGDITAGQGNGGGHGYFVRLRTNITGSRGVVEDITEFSGNKAHSNSQTGFWRLGNFVNSNSGVIENYTGHHNRLSNMWIRWRGLENPGTNTDPLPSTFLTIKDSKFSDSLNGLYVASSGTLLHYSDVRVENNTFVGESENQGTVNFELDEVWGIEEDDSLRTLPLNKSEYSGGNIVQDNNRGLEGIRGIELYDGPTYYDGNTFINFVPNELRTAAAYTLTFDTPYQQHPYTSTTDNTFINSNEVWWQPEFIRSGARSIILHDQDGSITGTPNTNIFNNNNILVEDDCDYIIDWNAHTCPQKNAVVLQLNALHEKNRNHISQFLFTRDATGETERMDRAIGGNRNFATNIYPNEWYTYSGNEFYDEFKDNPWNSRRFSELRYQNVYDFEILIKHVQNQGDFVGVKIPMQEPPLSLMFNPRNIGGGTPGDPETITQLFTKVDIYDAEETSYFYDYDEKVLYAKLFAQDLSKENYKNYWDTPITLIIDHDESMRTGESREFYSSTENPYFKSRYMNDTKVCEVSLSGMLDENDNPITEGSVEVDSDDERIINVTAPQTPGTYKFTYTPCIYITNYLQNGDFVTIHDLDEDIDITPQTPRERRDNTDNRVPDLPQVEQIIEVKQENQAPVMEAKVISTQTDNTKVENIVVSDADFNFKLNNSSTLRVVKQPKRGSIEVVSGTSRVRYTPVNPGDKGEYEFILEACDDVGDCSVQTFTLLVNGPIEVTNPVQYQVIQRNINGKVSNGNILIEGNLGVGCGFIEARMGDNEYKRLVRQTVENGTFSGTLTKQETGRAHLDVRCGNINDVSAQVRDVAIGDVYVVAGQSNAEGHGENRQKYSDVAGDAQNFPSVFDEFDRWKIGNDNTDRGARVGSVWPIVGGYITKETEVPVAFITTARGSKNLVHPRSDWQDPIRNNFEPLDCLVGGENRPDGPNCYQNMLSQVEQSNVNSVRAVLWLQGEEDVNLETTRADYRRALIDLSTHMRRDLPGIPKLVAGVIGPNGPKNSANRKLDDIRLATIEAWRGSNVLSGPQTYDIDIQDDGEGDNIHFTTDDELRTLGYRWWKSLEGHFYSDKGGTETVVDDLYFVGERNPRAIGIRFKDIHPIRTDRRLYPGDLDPDLFTVREFIEENGQTTSNSIEINRVRAFEDAVFIFTVNDIENFENIRVSYGMGNFAQGKLILAEQLDDNVFEDSIQGIPVTPFRSLPIQRELVTQVNRVQPSNIASQSLDTNQLSILNNQVISKPLIVEVENNVFIDENIIDFVEFTNVPNDLEIEIERVSDNIINIFFINDAGNYSSSDSISGVDIEFLPGAFEENKLFDTFEETIIENSIINFDDTSTQGLDDDNDGIPNSDEENAPNNGDGNGDGVADSTQTNVASIENSLVNDYITMSVSGECEIINNLSIKEESQLPTQDQFASYPYGLLDFRLSCSEVGGDALVEIVMDKEYDTSNWEFKKFTDASFQTITDAVNITDVTLGGVTKTKFSYRIIDGSSLDSDDEVNGVILDPIGIALTNTQDNNTDNDNSGSDNSNNQNNNQGNNSNTNSNNNNNSNPTTLIRTGGGMAIVLISIIVIAAASGGLGFILGKK